MSSAAFRQGRLPRPEDRELTPDAPEKGVDKHEKGTKGKGRQGRTANVYNAVAGQIASHGYVQGALAADVDEDMGHQLSIPIYPEEALFRRAGAPARIAEDDFYWADRHLTPDQKLPDSELLKEIHTFTADYYSRTTDNDPKGVYQTMDETALLAMGILLEESVAQVLGKDGDLAFVEGEPIIGEEEDGGGGEQSSRSLKPAPRSKRIRMPNNNNARKRRKVNRAE